MMKIEAITKMTAAPKTQEPQASPSVRKPHRWRPGTVALREIRQQQKSTKMLLPRASFERLVREIMQDMGTETTRIKPEAIDALQQGSEDYIVDLLKHAQKFAVHADRVTLGHDDLKLAIEEQGSVES